MALEEIAQGSRLKALGKNIWVARLASRPQPPAPNGFTFVELMVAATMMAVLFVGLGVHLRGGITVWQRATRTSEMLQRQRVALERIENELANAIVYDDQDSAYGTDTGMLPEPRFGANELQWFTVVPRASVRFVTYTCKQLDETTGLWRTSQSIGEARAKTLPPKTELVLSGCEDLRVAYAYKSSADAGPLIWEDDWQETYKKDKKLPMLLKISLVVSGAKIERTILIPPGELGDKSKT